MNILYLRNNYVKKTVTCNYFKHKLKLVENSRPVPRYYNDQYSNQTHSNRRTNFYFRQRSNSLPMMNN